MTRGDTYRSRPFRGWGELRPGRQRESRAALIARLGVTMRWISVLSIAVAIFSPTSIGAQELATAEIAPVEIREEGFYARLYLPEGDGPHPAVLSLGGSEGGIQGASSNADGLVRQGFAVLAVAYFKEEGLPDQLLHIPLETFTRGIDLLAAHERVDAERIAILGASKGAEAALLVASRDPRIAAVVAIVPSHVVWQAVDLGRWRKESSWTHDGEPLDFVAYDMSGGAFPLSKLYQTSLETHGDDLDGFAIPVEKISGPVLLLSGEDDRIWPSTLMAGLVVDRLEAKGFEHPVEHHAYPDAGHTVYRSPTRGEIEPDRLVMATKRAGGTPDGTMAAIEDSWTRVLEFLRDHL